MINNNKMRSVTNFSIDSIIGINNTHSNNTNIRCTSNCKSIIKIEQKKQQEKQCDTNDNNLNKKSIITPTPTTGATFKKKPRPKNFQCPVCPMAFSNNGQLKNHVRIHTGERPFRCNFDQCDRTFTRNEELTRHKLIHTGVRLHACSECNKRFGRKDHLKKHVKTHEKLAKKKIMTTKTTKATKTMTIIRRKSTLSSSQQSKKSTTNRLMKQRKQVEVQHFNDDETSDEKPINVGCATDLFQPGHQQQQHLLSHMQLPGSNITAPNSTFTATTTTTTNISQLQQTSTTTLAGFNTPTPMDLQRLANDYWQTWYGSLLSYQRQMAAAAAAAAATTSITTNVTNTSPITNNHPIYCQPGPAKSLEDIIKRI